jgi:hypothetical protein
MGSGIEFPITAGRSQSAEPTQGPTRRAQASEEATRASSQPDRTIDAGRIPGRSSGTKCGQAAGLDAKTLQFAGLS